MAQTTTTTSKQFTINLSDVWRGLIIAVAAPVIAIIIQTIDNGSLTFNWSLILKTALAAGLAYLLKNFLSTSKIVVHDAPPAVVEQVKEGTTEVKVGNVIAPTKDQQK